MNGTETYVKSWVIRLIMLNIAVFIVQILFAMFITREQGASLGDVLTYYLGLRPVLVIEQYYVWQLITYMFLHGGFFHIFLNMYALLIFGIPVEQAWGSKRFMAYYFFTGAGAGISILIINTWLGGANYLTPTIGASGAVFGLLLAFGMLFPDAEILIFFLIPMRAKFLVILYGGLELYSLIASGGQSPISHTGHLGGILFGLIFFLIIRKRGISFKSRLIKARLNREIDRKSKPARTNIADELMLEGILRKIREAGPAALTDDEYQYLKYMEIMTQDAGDICPENDFDPDDEYCKKCKNIDACLLRKIKSYL